MKKDCTVVIDTNLWISFLIKGFDTNLLYVLSNPAVSIAYSDLLIQEIKRTASYPRLQSKIRSADVSELIQQIERYFLKVNTATDITLCRDPKDNFLLALAKDAQADFLITNDEDLLVLDPFEKTRILKLSHFLSLLSDGGNL